jgi:nucleoside-diphosphate-sugar epimerase
LQGEQAVIALADSEFSAISLRKGTVSGFSPRMRLDLIVNTMFKTALKDGVITVNNPSIWRPILSVNDAANAYVRAVEAPAQVSGVFNVASGNYTVGEIGDLVKQTISEELGVNVHLNIKHIEDYRNYKVSFEKAANVLSFHPQDDVCSIVHNLIENKEKFSDWDNPQYYNIVTMRAQEVQAVGAL